MTRLEPGVQIHPVTPERWEDLLSLFGPNGAYSNCWCTWWMLTGKDFDTATKQARRDLLHTEVTAGQEPGLLAYRDGEAIGWCAVGPRRRFARLNSPRARVYRRIDDRASWVVNCFYVRKDQRRSGLSRLLLAAAVDQAARNGATLIEGYPRDTAARPVGAAELFVGTLDMFTAAGFQEVGRVGDRPLVRLELG
jgi:GNAT superfamily N-acetyltransferase